MTWEKQREKESVDSEKDEISGLKRTGATLPRQKYVDT